MYTYPYILYLKYIYKTSGNIPGISIISKAHINNLIIIIFMSSYRMDQVMTGIEIKTANLAGKKNVVYMRIIYAVDMHRKAMK